MAEKHRHLSGLLAKVLRHNPELIGIDIEKKGGWVEVKQLLEKLEAFGETASRLMLEEIVETDEKGRYSFDKTGTKFRANQGHSIDVEMDMAQLPPPEILYHGTATRMLPSIFQSGGLRPMKRQYVHLSTDIEMARKVGRRHGTPIVLQIRAAAMAADGHIFYLSDNGIWQTDKVPVAYIEVLNA